MHLMMLSKVTRPAAFTLTLLIRINCIRPKCDHYYADCRPFQIHALHDIQIHVYLEFLHEQVPTLLAAWYQAAAVKSEGSFSSMGCSDFSSLSFDPLVCENFYLSRLQLKSSINHRGIHTTSCPAPRLSCHTEGGTLFGFQDPVSWATASFSGSFSLVQVVGEVFRIPLWLGTMSRWKMRIQNFVPVVW